MSYHSNFRQRRHAMFVHLLFGLPRPLRILDVGGDEKYWSANGTLPDCEIVILNHTPRPATLPGFSSIVCDACDMAQIADQEFDVVFSNSCIEHVGCAERQAAMAREIRRVGRGYFVQAPYRHFPLEPHYHMPLFQYWPRKAQEAFCRLRYREPRHLANGLRELDWLRLPTLRDFRQWFPGANIYQERIGPLTKSLVAYHLTR